MLGAKDFVSEILSTWAVTTRCCSPAWPSVLAAGTFLESVPNTIILAPILAPVAGSVGVDPIHFAVVFLVGDAIGFITPPYGLNLYVASGITGIPYFRIFKISFPYFVALICAWMIIALWPPLTKFLVDFSVAGAGTFGGWGTFYK